VLKKIPEQYMALADDSKIDEVMGNALAETLAERQGHYVQKLGELVDAQQFAHVCVEILKKEIDFFVGEIEIASLHEAEIDALGNSTIAVFY
jgi:hypothetical protein